MRQLAENLWVIDIPFRMQGVDVGARATVVRLSDGALWVHSPVTLSDAVKAQLAELGPVRYLVSPNKFHYLDMSQWTDAYPEALTFAAPGVSGEARERIEVTLDDTPRPEWAADLDQMLFHGSRLDIEAIFFHRASRTLILTDLVLHIPRERDLWTRLVASLLGVAGKFRPSRLFKLSLRDRAATRQSLRYILSWDFDRVVMAHGTVVEAGGKKLFRRAFYPYL